MNKFFLIFFLLVSITGFSQDIVNPQPKADQKRLLIGLSFSTDYCYRSLEFSVDKSNDNLIIDMRNEVESPKLSYSFGAKVLYKISSNIAIEMGLQYSNNGFALRSSDLYFGDQIDPRYGFVYSTADKNFKSITNFTYLEIPVRAIYSCREKKIRFTSSLGLTTSLPLKATTTFVSEDKDGNVQRGTSELQCNFKRTNFFPTISAGIDYNLSESFSFKAEPTFRYGIINIQENFATTYLWNFGLNISCYYTLK